MSSSTVPPIQPFTVIEPWRFEAITPSQFITLTMPNPLTNRRFLHRLVLRVAVLDSPLANADDESPVIAAMIVPNNRETDWIFCSESGHIQLLLKSLNVSRLIVIGNNPPPDPGLAIFKRPPVIDHVEQEKLINELQPLLMSLHPKVSFNNGLPETPFWTYEDDVAYRVTVATLEGPIVGEFIVEDIELVGGTSRNKQLRRRMRFKRMPALVQSEALLIPIIPYDEGTTQTDLESLRKIEKAAFEADTSILVHQYLINMVTCLFLIVSHLDERFKQASRPTALCLGIGGGVLLNFLNTELGFNVTGIDADETVVTAATEHFEFNKSRTIRLYVKDALEAIQIFQNQKPEENKDDDSDAHKDIEIEIFDMVMVDLDSSEVKNGFSSPPTEFVTKPVFEGLRSILDDHGVLVIHVVPLNEVFFTTLVQELKEIFHKVYGIDVGDQEICVVMAIVSETSINNNDNEFLRRLKASIPETDMNSIVEL